MAERPGPVDDEPADEPDDELGARLGRTFATHAADAPLAVGLAARVRSVRRQQVLRRSVVAGAAMAAVAAAVVVPTVLTGGDGGSPVGPAVPGATSGVVPTADEPTADEPLPPGAGWRWESYGGVELQVPASWGLGTTDSPWCLGSTDGSTDGAAYVGRPGPVEAIGCDDASLAEQDRRYVWFGADEPAGRVVEGPWVRETRLVGQTSVTVQLDDADLAEQILASARVVEGQDAAGCAATSPLAAEPGLRPQPWDLTTAGVVGGASVCRYALASELVPTEAGSLLASRALDAAAAAAALDAMAAAPAGSGPNAPESCLVESAYGEELVVMTFTVGDALLDVVVRDGGCDHHGIDDGTLVRELTPEVAAAVYDEATLPKSWSGELDPVFAPLWDAIR